MHELQLLKTMPATVKMLSEMTVAHLHYTVGAAGQLWLSQKYSSLLDKPMNHC